MNEKLNHIGLVESPSCTFCREAAESVEHLLFSCKISSDFWKHVLSWLRDNNVFVGTIDESDLILWKFNIVNDFILINHILLLGKYYIYCRRCLNSLPTLRAFIARTRRVYNIELHIARIKNKLLVHFQKWEKLIKALMCNLIDMSRKAINKWKANGKGNLGKFKIMFINEKTATS